MGNNCLLCVARSRNKLIVRYPPYFATLKNYEHTPFCWRHVSHIDGGNATAAFIKAIEVVAGAFDGAAEAEKEYGSWQTAEGDVFFGFSHD